MLYFVRLYIYKRFESGYSILLPSGDNTRKLYTYIVKSNKYRIIALIRVVYAENRRITLVVNYEE